MDGNDRNPVPDRARTGRSSREWWPDRLNVRVLHQDPPVGNPMGTDFNYAEEFRTVDLDALKKDIEAVMTTSQDWWPADYGHYGRSSSGWRGTARAPTASATAGEAPGRANSASRR
jgi:catalase-peroxidase